MAQGWLNRLLSLMKKYDKGHLVSVLWELAECFRCGHIPSIDAEESIIQIRCYAAGRPPELDSFYEMRRCVHGMGVLKWVIEFMRKNPRWPRVVLPGGGRTKKEEQNGPGVPILQPSLEHGTKDEDQPRRCQYEKVFVNDSPEVVRPCKRFLVHKHEKKGPIDLMITMGMRCENGYAFLCARCQERYLKNGSKPLQQSLVQHNALRSPENEYKPLHPALRSIVQNNARDLDFIKAGGVHPREFSNLVFDREFVIPSLQDDLSKQKDSATGALRTEFFAKLAPHLTGLPNMKPSTKLRKILEFFRRDMDMKSLQEQGR